MVSVLALSVTFGATSPKGRGLYEARKLQQRILKNGVQPLSEGRTTRKRKQMSETILTAENLKFRYDSEQPGYALNGVSMQVGRGEFVAVLGANGCGKSTLAKHFNAILLPEEGKVYVEGMDTADDDKLYVPEPGQPDRRHGGRGRRGFRAGKPRCSAGRDAPPRR